MVTCACSFAGTSTCDACKNRPKCPGANIKKGRPYPANDKIIKSEVYKVIRETFKTEMDCTDDMEYIKKLSLYVTAIMEGVGSL